MVKAFRKLDYLLACDTTTRVFTDHRNLLFAFSSVVMDQLLVRHKVMKVIRWTLFLSASNYCIEHVSGDINIWPDIMIRWMRGYRRTPRVRRGTFSIPFHGVKIPPESPEFEWPTTTEMVPAQK